MPVVTEAPVPKLPFVNVIFPDAYAAVAPDAEVTTVLLLTGVIEVVLPAVCTAIVPAGVKLCVCPLKETAVPFCLIVLGELNVPSVPNVNVLRSAIVFPFVSI